MNELWTASYIVLWLVVASLVFLMMGLLRQLGLVQLRLGEDPGVLITPEGLERGVTAPDFQAIDVFGKVPVNLHEFSGHRVLLAFVSPGCLACRHLMPHLNDVAQQYRDKVQVVTMCYANRAACEEFARQTKLRTIILADPENSVASAYGVRMTPFAFLIDEQGTILIRGVVNTWPQLDALLAEEGTFQGHRPWKADVEAESVIAYAHDSRE